MREILFRGKRVDNGEWVYGYVSEHTICGEQTTIETVIEEKPKHIYDCNTHIARQNTISQYTGLTDKNGQKIFEGDICRVGDLLYKVVFSYGQWNFEIISTKYYCCPCFYSNCGEYCEVIGNIFDNPELLQP